jgi:hypothetical protein
LQDLDHTAVEDRIEKMIRDESRSGLTYVFE